MVLLIIIAPYNDHTVYFKEPIERPSYIRLPGCSLYNSWHNLKGGEVTFYDKVNNPQQPTPIIPGYYTLEILASTLENMLKKEFGVKIPT